MRSIDETKNENETLSRSVYFLATHFYKQQLMQCTIDSKENFDEKRNSSDA